MRFEVLMVLPVIMASWTCKWKQQNRPERCISDRLHDVIRKQVFFLCHPSHILVPINNQIQIISVTRTLKSLQASRHKYSYTHPWMG